MIGRIRNNRTSKDLPDFSEDENFEETVSKLNIMVSFLNFFTKKFSLTSSTDSYTANVIIPATSNIKVQHFLGVKPSYRLILNQEGNGVISDIPSEWNTKTITLRNNGSVEVKATVLILKE